VRRAAAAAALATLALGVADAAATFPGSNGRIAYVSGGIWTARPDGSFRRPLLRRPGLFPRSVEWSPDGRRLVFAADDLYTVRSDGGGLRRLTRTSGYEEEPSWSPDGRRIAYLLRDRSSYRSSLWTTDARGGDRRRLADAGYGGAEWAPDGRSIAYPFATGGLGLLDLATGEARRISPVEYGSARVSWSPDSAWIAFEQHEFTHDYPCQGCRPGFDLLAKVRPDGTGYQELARGQDRLHVSPLWSPDGRRLAYCVGISGSYERWTMSPDGGDRRRAWASGCSGASWQPRPR
jgi:Tol biopolymer transport system component